jgi:predicted enzyme related to lactoylglutathione lyase
MSAFAEGAPCWADAVLPDLAAGRAFYGELFGWTFQDLGEQFGHYTMAARDGRNVAALMSPPEGGASAGWSVHLATADAARAAARIPEAGGKVLDGPRQVGEAGLMVVAADPGGSVLGVWQPGGHRGFDLVGEPGAYCWAESHTRDAEAVDTFLAEVFGLTSRQIGDGKGFDYAVWSPQGGEPVLGRMKEGPDGPVGYRVYFVVPDCDAAVATVQRLGGTLASGPDDSPFGRMALVTDDQGAPFAVIDTTRRRGEAPGR